MTTKKVEEAVKDTELWFAVLDSLHKFDELEVNGVVNSILSPTLPEECVISTYYRAQSNVCSLLEFKHPKHFQAIGMIARSLFELAVDIALIGTEAGAPLKMRGFNDIEKLKTCRSVVAFENQNPLTMIPSSQLQQDYISNNEARIVALAQSLWPGKKLRDLSHWSGMTLSKRVGLLPLDMQELYACFYKQLSWAVHPGLQGSYGLKPETFAHFCGQGYILAARNYERILSTIIRTTQLDKHDPLIGSKMQLARYLPLTESEQDELALRRDLGLL